MLTQTFGSYSDNIYFRNCSGSPYVLCKELLFSQMNRISILQIQVSMTIKTKQSSGPTWYLMENAAAVQNSSVFILLLYRSTGTLFPQSNPTASPVVPTQTQTATAERVLSTLLKKITCLSQIHVYRKVQHFAIVMVDFKLRKLIVGLSIVTLDKHSIF